MKKLFTVLTVLLLACSITFSTVHATPLNYSVMQTKHLKKDGTPDKRFKENKHLKKDGTPDKRFKANKTKKKI